MLATPIGLALPEPDKAVKKFNLLPPEVARRSRMKHIQERTLLGAAAAIALLVLFGGWKLLKVHDAQNNVNGLQSNIAALNSQIPKYDLVVAANNAYTAGVTRRASVINTAVDWPLALNTLISITPANAEVQAFDGSAVTTTTGAAAGASTAASSAAAASGTVGTPAAPKSAAIGTVQLSVTGPGPSLSSSEAWINAVAGSKVFANPLQGATVANPDGTISFPFTVSVTPTASLDQNGNLK